MTDVQYLLMAHLEWCSLRGRVLLHSFLCRFFQSTEQRSIFLLRNRSIWARLAPLRLLFVAAFQLSAGKEAALGGSAQFALYWAEVRPQ